MSDLLQFGMRVSGAEYRTRPGGYAIVFRQGGDIALVETVEGVFLPGGGQQPGETPELAALRETCEECGFRIAIRTQIGVADEFVFASDVGLYFRKHCTYFAAEFLNEGEGGESGHKVRWMTPASAVVALTHDSQRWAVSEAFGIPGHAIPGRIP